MACETSQPKLIKSNEKAFEMCANKVKMETIPSFGLEMREKEFKLRDDVTSVNHASYGVVPETVKKAQQRIRDEAESFPEIWFRKNRNICQDKARYCISDFLGADPDDVVFIENVTAGFNCILKSLRLGRNDTILYSDQTFRSMQNACKATRDWIQSENLGMHVESLTLSFPIRHEDEVVNKYRNFFMNNTNVKMAVFEHVSCPSAIRMPIEKLVPLCKEFGVMCVVDGAHGPGQFNLNLRELNPDFYLGNLYKWLYGPWNCGIMYVKKRLQNWIRPLITARIYTKTFQDDFSNQGVKDYSAFCTVSAAVKFYNDIGGHEKITSYTDGLLNEAVDLMASSCGTKELEVPKSMMAPNMRMVQLPVSKVCGIEIKNLDDSDRVITYIAEKYKIGAAFTFCNGKVYIRLSANIYNTKEDFIKLNEFVIKHIINNDCQ